MAKGEPILLSSRASYLSDAVHGRIDLSDPVLGEGAIARIIQSRFLALHENLDKCAFYAAFWKATNWVLVAAKRCAFSSK